MDYYDGKYILSQNIKKTSLVLLLLDDFTGGGVLGNFRIYLDKEEITPVKNPGGYCLFYKIYKKDYTLRVESDYYVTYREKLKKEEIDNKEEMTKTIILKPSGAYPFLGSATLARGVVVDSSNSPSVGAPVKATVYQYDRFPLGKIDKNGVGSGESQITLTNLSSMLKNGNLFIIKDADVVKTEYCQVKEVLSTAPNKQVLSIETPTLYSHQENTNVFTAVVSEMLTETTDMGQFVIYVKPVKSEVVIVKSEIGKEGLSTVTCMQVLKDGTTKSFGKIKI